MTDLTITIKPGDDPTYIARRIADILTGLAVEHTYGPVPTWAEILTRRGWKPVRHHTGINMQCWRHPGARGGIVSAITSRESTGIFTYVNADGLEGQRVYSKKAVRQIFASAGVNPDRDAALGQKVHLAADNRDSDRVAHGRLAGEPQDHLIDVHLRIDLERLSAVVQDCHDDSSTAQGRPESVLSITVEVRGAGAHDSRPCASCGGAA